MTWQKREVSRWGQRCETEAESKRFTGDIEKARVLGTRKRRKQEGIKEPNEIKELGEAAVSVCACKKRQAMQQKVDRKIR
jgi:hypothetical protein